MIVFSLIFLVLISNAQEKYSLEKCREMALENSYNIKVAEKQIESAGEQTNAEKRDYYPFIDVYGTYKFLQEPLQLEIANTEYSGENNQYQLGVNVTQPLYTGGYLNAKKEIAEFNENIAMASKNQVSDFVLFSTELQFWETVYFKQFLRNVDDFRGLLDILVSVVKDKVDNDIVSRNDLLMVEVKQNEVKLEQYKARKNLNISFMQLNRVMGINVNEQIDVQTGALYEPFTVPVFESFDSVLNNRPEYALQKSTIDVNTSNIEITKSQYRPSVVVGVTPYWGNPSTNLLGDGPMYNSAIMASVNVPVFHWGKKKNLVNVKKINLESSKIELEDIQENISLEVNSALYQVQEATERIIVTEESMDKARENVDIITERYKSGLSPIIEVLDAQASWIKAYNEEIAAKVSYFQSLAIYKKAIGEL